MLICRLRKIWIMEKEEKKAFQENQKEKKEGSKDNLHTMHLLQNLKINKTLKNPSLRWQVTAQT